ncbi:MAG: hypothetical protein Ta2B_04570 [Termitinemataceae bacterium]|nr:MAG: hypothetical protein Ta2B_04570 [Termitinemataceae bacterium]
MCTRKYLFSLLFIFLFSVAVAQEKNGSKDDTKNESSNFLLKGRELDLGAGIDFNGYSDDDLTYSLAFSADWRLMSELSTGLRFALNFDFNTTRVAEISSVVRFFFIRRDFFEGFVGAEIGYALVTRGGADKSDFIAGINAGCRFLFLNGDNFPPWYLEPHIRFGYAFLWDAGFVFGYRLPSM